MTRNQLIVQMFCEHKSVLLLSRLYPDLAQPDIEEILRKYIKRHGRAANPKKRKVRT